MVASIGRWTKSLHSKWLEIIKHPWLKLAVWGSRWENVSWISGDSKTTKRFAYEPGRGPPQNSGAGESSKNSHNFFFTYIYITWKLWSKTYPISFICIDPFWMVVHLMSWLIFGSSKKSVCHFAFGLLTQISGYQPYALLCFSLCCATVLYQSVFPSYFDLCMSGAPSGSSGDPRREFEANWGERGTRGIRGGKAARRKRDAFRRYESERLGIPIDQVAVVHQGGQSRPLYTSPYWIPDQSDPEVVSSDEAVEAVEAPESDRVTSVVDLTQLGFYGRLSQATPEVQRLVPRSKLFSQVRVSPYNPLLRPRPSSGPWACIMCNSSDDPTAGYRSGRFSSNFCSNRVWRSISIERGNGDLEADWGTDCGGGLPPSTWHWPFGEALGIDFGRGLVAWAQRILVQVHQSKAARHCWASSIVISFVRSFFCAFRGTFEEQSPGDWEVKIEDGCCDFYPHSCWSWWQSWHIERYFAPWGIACSSCSHWRSFGNNPWSSSIESIRDSRSGEAKTSTISIWVEISNLVGQESQGVRELGWASVAGTVGFLNWRIFWIQGRLAALCCASTWPCILVRLYSS